jgi:LytS/YehU family sensor histidine kinase
LSVKKYMAGLSTGCNALQQVIVAFIEPLVLYVQASDAAADVSTLLRQEDQIQKTLLFALIPVVVAFSFIVFIFYRAKRESFFKQKEAEFNFNKSELELKALRAQINPHFIFNCLNSIHHYMHRSDVPKAGEYLVKFSQLIRHVLETSSYRMIPLADDLQALKLYIQLEQLRMDHSFEFEITTMHDIDTNAVQVPPLLIQPFVENSIWHGLNNRGKDGKISILIRREGDMLTCIIEDNGREGGLKESYDLSNAVKKTSMGMALINERLEVVNQLYNVKAHYTLADMLNNKNEKEGKRVTLLLPYED